MATVADITKEEMMKPCECGRNKAIYYCKEKSCPSHTKRPVYCIFCFEDDVHPDHKPVRISKEIEEWKAKWLSLKEQLANMEDEAIKIQKPFKCLIHMCERLFSAPRNHKIEFRSLA